MPYSALRTGRISTCGQVYLVTTVTAGRQPLFTDLYVGRIAVQALRTSDRERATRTLAFVVMPDHVHWLFELIGTQSLSAVLRRFKGRTARIINDHFGKSGRVWQPSFHDHGVRNEESLVNIAQYVIMNPVRASLIEKVGDYSLWDAMWV